MFAQEESTRKHTQYVPPHIQSQKNGLLIAAPYDLHVGVRPNRAVPPLTNGPSQQMSDVFTEGEDSAGGSLGVTDDRTQF